MKDQKFSKTVNMAIMSQSRSGLNRTETFSKSMGSSPMRRRSNANSTSPLKALRDSIT